jgi:hypothetical protein
MDPEAFNRDFHYLLGRLVHAHARFDFNVGLQLNWMGPMYGVEASEVLSPYKGTFKARLDLFKRIVLDVYQPAGVAFVTEFRTWFDRAEKCRVLRNDYAHGRWGVPGKFNFKKGGRMIDAEPLLVFVPLDWNMEPDREDRSITLTMQEFKEQVEEAEAVFSDYSKLTKRFEKFAKPRLPAAARDLPGL